MNHSSLIYGPASTLPEILDARERRAQIQQELLNEYKTADASRTLICFTLNIVGPVKVFPLTVWAFQTGVNAILKILRTASFSAFTAKKVCEPTGYEAYFISPTPAKEVKKALTELENTHPLGRLFDIDVITEKGEKISREELGYSKRSCLLCDNPAFICGRSRTHSAAELVAKEIEIMLEHYADVYASYIAGHITEAMRMEVCTTLKPGLVDRCHNGSHDDMDVTTFQKSADALISYFHTVTRMGVLFEAEKRPLCELFEAIRKEGVLAEATMKKATDGINTHKGMIFSGGILCCCAGLLADAFLLAPSKHTFDKTDFKNLTDTSKKLVSALANDYTSITQKASEKNTTHGEELFLKYGIKGARQEALLGFPSVFGIGFMRLYHLLSEGFSLNDAGCLTLLSFIAFTEDTNIISRSDPETAQKIRSALGMYLASASFEKQLEILKELDDFFVCRHISPGGCADMLALTYFLHRLLTKPFISTEEQEHTDFILRKAEKKDISSISRLMQSAAASTKRREWFAADDDNYIKDHIEGHGFTIVAEAPCGEIAGFFIIKYPGFSKDNLGHYLNLPEMELPKVVHMDSAVVLPDYRGHRLQERMLKEAEKHLMLVPCRYLMCTIHPDNHYSRANMEKNGYQVVASDKMYGGFDRLVLLKKC